RQLGWRDCRLPELDLAVATGRRKLAAVWRKRDSPDQVFMAWKSPLFGEAFGVVEHDETSRTDHRQRLLVRAEHEGRRLGRKTNALGFIASAPNSQGCIEP